MAAAPPALSARDRSAAAASLDCTATITAAPAPDTFWWDSTKETRTLGIHSKPSASVAIVDSKVRATLREQLSFVPVKGSNRLNATDLIIHDWWSVISDLSQSLLLEHSELVHSKNITFLFPPLMESELVLFRVTYHDYILKVILETNNDIWTAYLLYFDYISSFLLKHK